MYIENTTSNTLVSGTSSADSIISFGNYVTSRGSNGNDTIFGLNYNYETEVFRSDYCFLDGGNGDDILALNESSHSTLNGGSGDDNVYVWDSSYNSLSGGAGDDYLKAEDSSYNTLNGGTGNDVITLESSSNNVIQYTIGDGDDTIYGFNSTDRLEYTGSGLKYVSTIKSGSDTIMKNDKGSIIFKDYTFIPYNIISSDISNTIISGSSDDDSIHNFDKYVTVSGGSGNDTIDNTSWGDYSSLSGGLGNDSINAGYTYSVTLNGGYGNDTLVGSNDTVYGDVFQIGNRDDYDIITNYETNDTIHLTGTSSLSSSNYYSIGDDRVISLASDGIVTIKGGAKKNIKVKLSNGSMTTIYAGNSGNDTLIPGTSNSDSIYNSRSNVLINVLAGNDTVESYGNYVTIDGGLGQDFIHSHGNRPVINAGDGNDTIWNCSTTSYVSNNATIYAGNGNDSVWNASVNAYTLVDLGAGNDIVSNRANNVTLKGDSGNDFFYSYGSNSVIDGGNDNDTLWVYNKSSLSAVYGGAGNDQFISAANKSTLNGGAGNDTIQNVTSQVTIIGGLGNDVISLGSDSQYNTIIYNVGDGNDTIYGNNSTNKISISGSSYSTQKSGNDIIYNVGSGSLRVINGTTPDTKVTPQEVIKKFMKSLDTTNYSGISALSQAVSVASGGYFKDVQTAISQMVADCRNAGNATTFLKNYCGIDLSNNDTGAITGSDAGGSTILTAESVVPESGNLDTSFNSNSFKTNYGATFYLSKTSSLSNNDELYIWRALKTWWANESFKLIKNSYDYSFADSDASVKNITVEFEENHAENYLAKMTNSDGIQNRVLTINKVYYYNFNNTDVNGKSPKGEGYLDRTIAHELTHAIMMAKINNFHSLPQFITEGTAELVHGIDDEREPLIKSLAGNSNRLSNALNLWDTSTGTNDAYAGGFMFLRYLAKQSSEHSGISNFYSNTPTESFENDIRVKGALLTLGENFTGSMLDLNSYPSATKVDATKTSKGVMIVGNQKANTISAGSGNDTISGNTGNDKILGGKGNDVIAGDAGNDSINGGAGNDTLAGGDGNDTLTGGAGKDIFIHNANNDLITDYKAGEDKIKLSAEGAAITSSSTSGSDVILTINGTEKITVKGGNNQKITIVDSKGKETTKIYSKSKGDTLSADTLPTGLTYNNAKTTLTVGTAYTGTAIDLSKYASTVKTVDASKRTKSIKITGNTLANSIVGGTGADTITGGKGADTLTGGSGADVFIYKSGDGNDTIIDYSAQDKVSITGGTYTKSTVGNDVKIKVGSGSILLKNAKNKTITINNSKSFEERWFMESDNNLTTNALDSIIKDSTSNAILAQKEDAFTTASSTMATTSSIENLTLGQSKE